MIEMTLVLASFTCASAFCQSESTPKFEVASVKPCNQDSEATAGGAKGVNGAGRAPVTNRLELRCQNVRFLLRLAYAFNGPGFNPMKAMPIFEGAPGWIDSERYTIEAVAPAAADSATIHGPMLRALLEERFNLKIRRETREVPAYALTVAKGGLKLVPPGDRRCTEPYVTGQNKDGSPIQPLGCSKLQRAEPGLCVPRVAGQSYHLGDKPICGVTRAIGPPGAMVSDVLGGDLSQLARSLNYQQRQVIDKTGVTEKFDFHLEYALDMPNSPEPYADAPTGPPSLPTVLAELGLKLERTVGQQEFLVIDHIQRPSEN
jgi:uncharacterized protein (TIGR03435 family)